MGVLVRGALLLLLVTVAVVRAPWESVHDAELPFSSSPPLFEVAVLSSTQGTVVLARFNASHVRPWSVAHARNIVLETQFDGYSAAGSVALNSTRPSQFHHWSPVNLPVNASHAVLGNWSRAVDANASSLRWALVMSLEARVGDEDVLWWLQAGTLLEGVSWRVIPQSSTLETTAPYAHDAVEWPVRDEAECAWLSAGRRPTKRAGWCANPLVSTRALPLPPPPGVSLVGPSLAVAAVTALLVSFALFTSPRCAPLRHKCGLHRDNTGPEIPLHPETSYVYSHNLEEMPPPIYSGESITKQRTLLEEIDKELSDAGSGKTKRKKKPMSGQHRDDDEASRIILDDSG